MGNNAQSKILLEKQLISLPNLPGVYKYFDKDDQLIYVGKAKDLRKRVYSYFNNNNVNNKTRVLVNKIRDIKFIIVDTEIDALLLENNLIKKHQPRYNVLLKDDKTFPWIVLKNEPFPRLTYTRKITKSKHFYYGPYTNAKAMHTLIETINNLYKLRTCNYNLSQENIDKGKFKVCLEYHIKNCYAPCVGYQTKEDYQETIDQIKEILRGGGHKIIKLFKEKMKVSAQKMAFEEAHEIKQKVGLLEHYVSSSIIVSPKLNELDVFSIVSDEKYAYINFIKIVHGAIIQSDNIELKKRLEETDKELLSYGLIEIRNKLKSEAKEIIVPLELEDFYEEEFKYTIPKRGEKKKLLDLSYKNLKHFYYERKKQLTLKIEGRTKNRVLEQLQMDINLKRIPVYMECFDNSNLQGTNPVAACVVFKNGRPSKKDYRHFNIKTVKGPDDYASMQEVIYRRYDRLIRESRPLPHLIVIDGGKGQLNAAVKSLHKLNLMDTVEVIGIAKRLEEIFVPGDSIPIYIDKKSPTLKLIQYIRNEAHRFGITHHRKKRIKNTLSSELLDIKGVGENSVKLILEAFGSVSRVEQATKKELLEVLKPSLVEKIWHYFHNH